MYDQSCPTSDPKRSWSVKIDQIENVRRLLQGLIKQREIEFGCHIGIGQWNIATKLYFTLFQDIFMLPLYTSSFLLYSSPNHILF